MKKAQPLLIFGFFAVCMIVVLNPSIAAYMTKVYFDNGGDRLTIESGGIAEVTGTIHISQEGIFEKNGLILDPTTIATNGTYKTAYQQTWAGLDADDKIVANLVEPVSATLYAAKANLGYATFYFSASIEHATIAAIALED